MPCRRERCIHRRGIHIHLRYFNSLRHLCVQRWLVCLELPELASLNLSVTSAIFG